MIRHLAIQHTFSEFLGTFEHQLEGRGIGFSYQRPMTGQDVAGSALQFDALWLLGGAWPVADTEHCPWVPDELRLVEIFRRAGRPVIGLGFGGHVVAQAFGGRPQPGPEFDARWTRAVKTAAGEGDPLAEAVHGLYVPVLSAGDVALPDGMSPILTDEAGQWLAIRPAPTCYGLNFRPELKPGMIEDMIMEGDRPTPDNIGDLLDETRRRWAELQQLGDLAMGALVGALDLMQERRKAPVFSLKVQE